MKRKMIMEDGNVYESFLSFYENIYEKCVIFFKKFHQMKMNENCIIYFQFLNKIFSINYKKKGNN